MNGGDGVEFSRSLSSKGRIMSGLDRVGDGGMAGGGCCCVENMAADVSTPSCLKVCYWYQHEGTSLEVM